MRTLLVANRGEIARRIFRTARAMGIATVAVFSDADAAAPFVAEADRAVRLPGNAPGDTYLRVDRILDAAQRTDADAVHPGYGFLSENAEFASAVVAAGLMWVGPPASAIAAMGSKLAAKQLMSDAGVPTLPWTTDADEVAIVGFPLLVKASAGGGGRGMRIVRDTESLAAAIDSASREAAGAFGDATVFLERYLDGPRHIEIQVFADQHGNVVSLFERECSIQRRHQKIIEEAPSPVVDATLRGAMGEAAVAAARAVDYVGAGTVEFVLDEDRQFFFLEMNTRLQVEHPVTEAVTGLDLVRLQLLVADGQPLPPQACHPTISGHAIEARLYAEDATQDFMPVTGVLRAFDVPDSLRVDSGVAAGSVVSPYYDAMLAKVIGHAPTRGEAAAVLGNALAGARIHGVTTNRDLLVRVLRDAEFLVGDTDTAYLDRHDLSALSAPLADDTAQRVHAIAAAVAVQRHHRDTARVLRRLPSGWRNNPSQPQRVELAGSAGQHTVEYSLSDASISVTVDGQPVEEVTIDRLGDDEVWLSVEEVRHRCRTVVSPTGDLVDVDSSLGASSYTIVPRFADPTHALSAGSLVAPMPGSVVRVLVEPDTAVSKGQPLVVLEAMKMEHTVTSPADGMVSEVRVRAGEQVDAGAVLAVVDEETA